MGVCPIYSPSCTSYDVNEASQCLAFSIKFRKRHVKRPSLPFFQSLMVPEKYIWGRKGRSSATKRFVQIYMVFKTKWQKIKKIECLCATVACVNLITNSLRRLLLSWMCVPALNGEACVKCCRTWGCAESGIHDWDEAKWESLWNCVNLGVSCILKHVNS